MLGDKTAARRLAQKAGIPVVPGTEDPVDPGTADLSRRSVKIGFPLIVKAAFGGGGRGMRVVTQPAELQAKVQEAQPEAGALSVTMRFFSNALSGAQSTSRFRSSAIRHGNILHLYERDCSVQRRHQKVVELRPAIGLPERVRRELADAAVQLGAAPRILQRRHGRVPGRCGHASNGSSSR